MNSCKLNKVENGWVDLVGNHCVNTSEVSLKSIVVQFSIFDLGAPGPQWGVRQWSHELGSELSDSSEDSHRGAQSRLVLLLLLVVGATLSISSYISLSRPRIIMKFCGLILDMDTNYRSSSDFRFLTRGRRGPQWGARQWSSLSRPRVDRFQWNLIFGYLVLSVSQW